MWKVNMLPPFVGKNDFRRSKFSINTCISFKYRTNWFKQSGIKFQESACIVLGADCVELTFGQISDVYIVSNKVLLQVHLLQTLFFSEHRHAFVVLKTKQMYFIWSTDIQNFRVYAVY